ncbi:MAG: hypothetical protein KDE31_06435 [Caldilineaceae bacterium]|nr:hypothetical protein [Caldilineaceae bacterium]
MKNSMYVRCIENRQFIHKKGEPIEDDEIYGLTIGKVYKRIPDGQAEQHNMIRVIDESFGEPGSEHGYMYPCVYFEPLDLSQENLERITLQVPAYVKDILHAEAVASNMSVSAFLRKWIDEQLDLPQTA